MNKKTTAIVILTIFTFVMVVGSIFASGDVSITRRDTSLTVTRADRNVPVKGTICINMERRSGDQVARNSDWWDFDLTGTKITDTWNAPAGWRIVSYSDVMCTIP